MNTFNEKTKISGEGVREIASESYRDINSQPERFAKASDSDAFLSEGWGGV